MNVSVITNKIMEKHLRNIFLIEIIFVLIASFAIGGFIVLTDHSFACALSCLLMYSLHVVKPL